MIKLTHLDGREFLLNENYIETIEATPDTVITMHTGQRIIVAEGMDEIGVRIRAFQRFLRAQDKG
ncbi:MAG: flagellar protein FlbD [Ruminococcus sp.]|nr:flagellar protein FlbD [Ruminococcus sp.]